jgi:hypothetical protein
MKPDNICRYLRTKKMYIPALAHEAFSPDQEAQSGPSHCWCNCTLAETGPDDQLASSQRCTKERSCFEE